MTRTRCFRRTDSTPRRLAVWVVFCGCLFSTVASPATETENFGLQAIPAPKEAKVDGKTDDWNLVAGVFACGDVQRHRAQWAVWLHAQYDAENVHLLARWIDPTPMNNPGSTKGDFPFNGDCLQFRTLADVGGPNEKGMHFSAWRDRDGVGQIKVEQGRNFKGGVIPDALAIGAQQAFAANPDGKGYVQEIALPWKLITHDGRALKAGESFTLTFEPNFTIGSGGRLTIKDVFKPGVAIDRVFTFYSYPCWGVATLAAEAPNTPRPVRLADGREFPTRMEGNVPVVDWTGLIKSREIVGLAPISFEMPEDGFVSLHIRDRNGVVVRQLLNAEFRSKGKQQVMWDLLTTPMHRTPGDVAAAGEYTWHAIYHTGLGVRLRGWASHGGSAPWENGPSTNWGGDHGLPTAVKTAGDMVLLGWSGSEAGKGMVACDLKGNVQWKHTRGAFGGALHIAVDGSVVYGVDGNDFAVFCLNPKTGAYTSWAGTAKSDVTVRQLFGEAVGAPDRLTGFDVRDGKAYLSCPPPKFKAVQVVDWLKLLERLKQDVVKGGEPAQTVWAALGADAWPRVEKMLAAGDLKLSAPEKRGQKDLIELAAAALAKAPEGWATEAFGGAVHAVQGNLVAVVDVKTGKLEKTIAVTGPGRLTAGPEGIVYVLSEGRRLLRLDAKEGKIEPVLEGLENAVSVTLDGEGNYVVGFGTPSHQVRWFSPEGKPLRSVGKAGGRPEVGPWQAEGLAHAAGVGVDHLGRLWVAENSDHPKRVSVWSAEGKLEREFYGPTHYGASGGAIHPADPNVMVGEGCEWKIDPVNGGHVCLGVFDTAGHGFVRFCRYSGREYLAASIGRGSELRIFERRAPGDYVLRGTIRPDSTAKTTTFWSDADGDGAPQAVEQREFPEVLTFAGYVGWSLNLAPDFTLYPAAKSGGYRIECQGLTKCGAPVWDLKQAKALETVGSCLPSLDHKLLLSLKAGGSDQETIKGVDQATGKVVWTYPNAWSGVHGSHRAPPPETGLMRGVFGCIGTFRLADRDVFALNTNVGEYHLLTGDGFYLSRLFNPDPLTTAYPEKAVPGAVLDGVPPGSGGEDFGGSLVQGDDGKVYVQSGKTALWNTEVVGLETVKTLPGSGATVTASEKLLVEAGKLREKQLQAAKGAGLYALKRGTPAFTGSISSDFRAAETLRFKKQDDAEVRTAAMYDDQRLYLAWQVGDKTPWVNGAQEAHLMYVGGDTVDFQLGADPAAAKDRAEGAVGDLRLSIGNFQGKPTAVLYRERWTEKKPQAFHSGVVQNHQLDYVVVLTEADVQVKVGRDSYTVEASIPLGALGLSPQPEMQLRGDFGATHGDQAGQRTRLRSYWNNQHTGIVDDVVFELKLEPRYWGEIVVQP